MRARVICTGVLVPVPCIMKRVYSLYEPKAKSRTPNGDRIREDQRQSLEDSQQGRDAVLRAQAGYRREFAPLHTARSFATECSSNELAGGAVSTCSGVNQNLPRIALQFVLAPDPYSSLPSAIISEPTDQ